MKRRHFSEAVSPFPFMVKKTSNKWKSVVLFSIMYVFQHQEIFFNYISCRACNKDKSVGYQTVLHVCSLFSHSLHNLREQIGAWIARVHHWKQTWVSNSECTSENFGQLYCHRSNTSIYQSTWQITVYSP